jgi:hypothetical protein
MLARAILLRHMGEIVQRYMQEENDLGFDEYLNMVCIYCVDERQLLAFLSCKDPLAAWVRQSPVTLAQKWQEAGAQSRWAISWPSCLTGPRAGLCAPAGLPQRG